MRAIGRMQKSTNDSNASFVLFRMYTVSLRASLLRQGIVQRDGELVGARSAAAAAVVALEQGRYILGVSAFEQLADGTEIARTAADEVHIVEPAVVADGKRDLLGADTLRRKGIRLHDFTFFLKDFLLLYAIGQGTDKSLRFAFSLLRSKLLSEI